MDRRTELAEALEQKARCHRLREIAERRNAAAFIAGLPEPFDPDRIAQLERTLAEATENLRVVAAAGRPQSWMLAG